jgi:hypothetical protein
MITEDKSTSRLWTAEIRFLRPTIGIASGDMFKSEYVKEV